MRTDQRLAQLWLDALATELGASAGTIDTYTDDLNCYLAWLDENSLSLGEVGLEQIRDYIAALDGRGYAGSTMARRITVARGLHKFLIAEELGSRDPTAHLSTMRRPRKLPFVLSIAETEALLETAHTLAADPSVGLYRQAETSTRSIRSKRRIARLPPEQSGPGFRRGTRFQHGLWVKTHQNPRLSP
jgi:integrase/recombinase XerD